MGGEEQLTAGGVSGDRIVAVLGGRQGSGYLIAPRLVLTARHVVAGGGTVRAAVPGGRGPVPCRVIWTGGAEALDAALLATDGDLAGPPAYPPVTAVRWGRTEGLEPVPGCQAIGFPRVGRDAGGRLDSEQFLGTLKPGSGLLGQRHVLDGVHHPPAGDGHGSPWAGMSGAAVFCRGLLAGVLVVGPERWGHARLEAVPAALLLADAGFRAALGREPECLPLASTGHDGPGRPLFERRAPVSHGPAVIGFGARRTLVVVGRDATVHRWSLDGAPLPGAGGGPALRTGRHALADTVSPTVALAHAWRLDLVAFAPDGGHRRTQVPLARGEFLVPSGGGGRLATHRGARVSVRDAATGTETCRIGLPGAVAAVAMSGDGGALAAVTSSGLSAGRLTVWDTGDGALLLDTRVGNLPLAGAAVALSPDGTLAACVTFREALAVRVADEAVLHRRRLAPAEQADALGAERIRVLCAPDGTVLWLRRGRLAALTPAPEPHHLPHHGRLDDIALSPDGNQLATTTESGQATVTERWHPDAR